MLTTHSTTDLDTLAIDLFSTRYGLGLDDSLRAAVAMQRAPQQTERALRLVARSGYPFLGCLRIVRDLDVQLAAEAGPSLALWGPPNPLCTACDTQHDPIAPHVRRGLEVR